VSNEEFEAYLCALDLTVEGIVDANSTPYIVIRDYKITAGPLAGTTCDVAIQRTTAIPYQPPPAIQTKPPLVPMDVQRYNVQVSPLGDDWQYWSRTVAPERQTPAGMLSHIATIFAQVAS